MTTILTISLPSELEARLDALAKKAGRTKDECVRQIILEHVEDLEDAHLADERIRTDTGERISLEDIMVEYATDLAAHPR